VNQAIFISSIKMVMWLAPRWQEAANNQHTKMIEKPSQFGGAFLLYDFAVDYPLTTYQ